MTAWQEFLKSTEIKEYSIEELKAFAKIRFKDFGVYPNSIQLLNNTLFFMAKGENEKMLVLSKSEEFFADFSGEEGNVKGQSYKVCSLSHENAIALRRHFSYTNPTSAKGRRFSFGLGDRLGLASAGQLETIKKLDVFPILAQQSMRELNLTGRTYKNVLDDASYAVFQEGYTLGFGADADHLKTLDEVRYGLDCGFTMITLDCSEHLNNDCFSMDSDTLKANYENLKEETRHKLEAEYINRSFKVDGETKLSFTKPELMQLALVYISAIEFIESIYTKAIKPSKRALDFEISIDETSVPTSPQAHFFLALELQKRGVQAINIAPRFVGEFQKGIDYIGNIAEFEEQFILHEKIAVCFGHRLSIHSGSDKFSVFPYIGKHTGLNVHVKTAGTHYLEALRLIALKDASLFREIYEFCKTKLDIAKQYYTIKATAQSVPDIKDIPNSRLFTLLDEEDSRQMLHITYGVLLMETDSFGNSIFKERLYKALHKFEEDYYSLLNAHLLKHFEALGLL